MGHNYVWVVKGGGCGKKSSSLRGDGRGEEANTIERFMDYYNVSLDEYFIRKEGIVG